MRPIKLPNGIVIDADRVIYISQIQSKMLGDTDLYAYRIGFEGNGITIGGALQTKLAKQRHALIEFVWPAANGVAVLDPDLIKAPREA